MPVTATRKPINSSSKQPTMSQNGRTDLSPNTFTIRAESDISFKSNVSCRENRPHADAYTLLSPPRSYVLQEVCSFVFLLATSHKNH